VPAVIVRCASCEKELVTYLNVLADCFETYSKVLIHEVEVRGYELVEGTANGQPDYYCIDCWEPSE